VQEVFIVCQRIECPKCKKPSFSGCGRHVEQVLGDVPFEERCRCREEARARGKPERSLLERLFGRS
jgi:hypothetical protein